MKNIMIAAFAGLLTLSLSAQSYKGAVKQQTPEEKLNELYCSGMFKSTDGTILDITSNANVSARTYSNILDWLPGRVAGLQVYTTRMGVSIPLIRGSVPGIYVDEIPVAASYLNMLNAADIAMIKVIKTPFYGGFNGGGGAIAIYTLKGEDEAEKED
jgi:TonB-dependent Receptor Plug Domain